MPRLSLLRLSTILTFAALSGSAMASDSVSVAVDQARVLHVDSAAASVVVGNPAIADAVLKDANTVFIIGRTFGVTNLLFVDGSGKEVANVQVSVGRLSSASVTLNKGSGQYTYACASGCDRVLFPTDADFKEVMAPNAGTKIDLGVSTAHKGSEGQD